MKIFATIWGINGIILMAIYSVAYGPGGGGGPVVVALLAPFVLAGVNLCLGLVSIVSMLVLRKTDKAAAAMADKAMQAFMIAFAVLFTLGVPACFLGITRL